MPRVGQGVSRRHARMYGSGGLVAATAAAHLAPVTETAQGPFWSCLSSGQPERGPGSCHGHQVSSGHPGQELPGLPAGAHDSVTCALEGDALYSDQQAPGHLRTSAAAMRSLCCNLAGQLSIDIACKAY